MSQNRFHIGQMVRIKSTGQSACIVAIGSVNGVASCYCDTDDNWHDASDIEAMESIGFESYDDAADYLLRFGDGKSGIVKRGGWFYIEGMQNEPR